ncbi:unnamed protein product [Schistocephalus solidus]|uniref:C2H2-type domain-containing protein n=1 Tax=Schistocephalus solidus TaxID=70667 RepID=A0A183THJ4_SCHSO|nr:unnamed protein product [Schistocephalus solidus]
MHTLLSSILTATATPTTMNDIPTASTDCSCPHCTRNGNSRIGLVDHLRIHRTEAVEPVPGAPTYSRRARVHCPHCSRTFTHRMGLLGHMRLPSVTYESIARRLVNHIISITINLIHIHILNLLNIVITTISIISCSPLLQVVLSIFFLLLFLSLTLPLLIISVSLLS